MLAAIFDDLPPESILSRIRDCMNKCGIPKFRFLQLYHSLQNGADKFETINELPKNIREQLIENFGETPLPLKIIKAQPAEQVEKVLFETQSGALIETVLSNYRAGWSSV